MRQGSLFLLVVVLFLNACGESDPTFKAPDKKAASKPYIKDPETPQDAINNLSVQHQKQFLLWQGQMLKSCNAREIFFKEDWGTDRATGIDYKLLYNQNENSFILNDGKAFAIANSYTKFKGTANTKYQMTTTINESSYIIEASSKRVGSICEIYLYGQKVFETAIVENVVINGFYTPEQKEKKIQAFYKLTHHPSLNLTQISNHHLDKLFWSGIEAKQDAYDFLSKKLNIKDIKKYFKVDGRDISKSSSSYKIGNLSNSTWFSYYDKKVIGDKDEIQDIFNPLNLTTNISFSVVIKTPANYILNRYQSPKSWSFNSTLKKSIDDKVEYFSLHNIIFSGALPASDETAATCFKKRAFILNIFADNTKSLHPNIINTESTCRIFTHDIKKALFDLNVYAEIFPVIFGSTVPASEYYYNEWDDRLIKLAVDGILKNSDLTALLDPESKTKVISDVIANIKTTKKLLTDYTELANVSTEILNLSASWAFIGEEAYIPKINYLLSTFNHSIDPFYNSTLLLIKSFKRRSKYINATTKFAQSLSSELKVKAANTLKLATELEYKDWIYNEFNQALQKHLGLDFFTRWEENLSQVKASLFKYPHLKNHYALISKATFKALKNKTLEISALPQIFLALNTLNEIFPDLMPSMLNKFNASYMDAKLDLDFAITLSTAYKTTLCKIKVIATELKLEDWINKTLNEFFYRHDGLETMQLRLQTLISAKDFSVREDARMAKESNTRRNDQHKEELILKALKEYWSDFHFSEFESIASYLSSQSYCKRYPGLSSVLDCYSLKHFSINNGKILDLEFDHRYAKLALDFSKYVILMEGFKFRPLRRSLVNYYISSFGNYLWQNCSMAEFNALNNRLKKMIKTYVINDNYSQSRIMKKAITDLLEQDCTAAP